MDFFLVSKQPSPLYLSFGLKKLKLKDDGEVSESFVKSQIFMAHALVRYMGMKSPVDLEAYGISGFKHLVALLSQVSRYF